MAALRRKLLPLLAVVASVTFAGGASAQTNAELDRQRIDAMRAFVNGNVDGALRIVDGVIARHAIGAMGRFGPHFGKYYYLKGLFHIRLNQPNLALTALQTCRDEYPNGKDKPGRPNPHFTSALILIGGIRFMEGDYDRAINADVK